MNRKHRAEIEPLLPPGFRETLRDHLKKDILSWWPRHAVDREQGGFFGRIDNDNRVYPEEGRSNLHVMEALANLYQTLPPDASMRANVARSLKDLVEVLCTKIVQLSFYLGLYFSDDCSVVPSVVSFGHDIEASWLIKGGNWKTPYHNGRCIMEILRRLS